jgi:hypothetical protein
LNASHRRKTAQGVRFCPEIDAVIAVSDAVIEVSSGRGKTRRTLPLD